MATRHSNIYSQTAVHEESRLAFGGKRDLWSDISVYLGIHKLIQSAEDGEEAEPLYGLKRGCKCPELLAAYAAVTLVISSLLCQIKALKWLHIQWCRGGVNPGIAIQKSIAALMSFEKSCTPAVADK